MSLVRISEKLAVAEQPSPGAFRQFKEDGFTAVINNHPNGEEPHQPGSAAEKCAAEDAGLGYRFIPVTSPQITEADVRAFQKAVADAPGPVLAHCGSGTRSLTLYAIGEVLDRRMNPEDIRPFGERFGFDLTVAEQWIARRGKQRPTVKGFFDPRTSSVQYVVADPATAKCAIIDPVLDFNERSGGTATWSADAILGYVAEQQLTVEWILDTHIHADHFSAAPYLQRKTGAPMAIGDHVRDVQQLWATIYNWPSVSSEGPFWDHLFADGERFEIGSLAAQVVFSPGHTLASITYLIGDAAFVHDTLFMPDSGTARTDFPGGDAKQLWKSIQVILALPDETRVFTGHDYQPGGRHPRWESTVAEQKRSNTHIADKTEDRFVDLRQERDRTLPMPKLILPALQVNIRGGRLPTPEDNGRSYLKIPLDVLPGAVW
jgi:uncharacterized protein (TIGR01244 family)